MGVRQFKPRTLCLSTVPLQKKAKAFGENRFFWQMGIETIQSGQRLLHSPSMMSRGDAMIDAKRLYKAATTSGL
jgi:hypothetical protein